MRKSLSRSGWGLKLWAVIAGFVDVIAGSIRYRHDWPTASATRGFLLTYAIDRPEITVRRRSTGWEAETIEGLDAEIPLPEIGVINPLAVVYAC